MPSTPLPRSCTRSGPGCSSACAGANRRPSRSVWCAARRSSGTRPSDGRTARRRLGPRRHPLRGRIRLEVPHGHRRDGARRQRAAATRDLRRPGAGERPTARHVERIGDTHPAPGPHVGRPARVALRVSRPPGNDRHPCAPDPRRRVPRGSARTAFSLHQPRLRRRSGADGASGERAVPASDGARALLAARHARHHGRRVGREGDERARLREGRPRHTLPAPARAGWRAPDSSPPSTTSFGTASSTSASWSGRRSRPTPLSRARCDRRARVCTTSVAGVSCASTVPPCSSATARWRGQRGRRPRPGARAGAVVLCNATGCPALETATEILSALITGLGDSLDAALPRLERKLFLGARSRRTSSKARSCSATPWCA